MLIGRLVAVVWLWVLGQGAPAFPSGPSDAVQAASRPAEVMGDAGLDRSPLAARRVVKTFDFDEQAAGNFGSVPAGWRRHEGVGFPLFLEGQFDLQDGHDKPPCYRLDLNGGSLAYHYQGRDIAVRPNCDYLVMVWVKTSRLSTARAFISAEFLDRKNMPIQGTDQRSELVGGESEGVDWRALTLRMRCDLPEVRYLGVSLWLAQKRVWDSGPTPLRAIEREDIRASAWFDDLTVYRMPRVSLTTSHPGGVFGSHEPVEVFPEVSDPDGLNLVARLKVHSTDGQCRDERTVAVRMTEQKPVERFLYPDLPVGLYRVELIVSTQDEVLVRRACTLARVADRNSAPVAVGRGFGVVLRSIEPAAVRAQSELLQDLRLELVKVPVWYAQRAMAGQLSIGLALDAYLEAIRATHADPVGVMMDDRVYEAASARGQMMSILDVFSEAPLGWKHLIASIWTRYAGLIHVWQVGNDGDTWVALDDRLPGLLPRLRKEMTELMATPMLAAPSSPLYVPSAVPADYQSLSLPSLVPAEDVEQYLAPLLAASKDRSRAWVAVAPLPEGPYPREQRLAEFGRRLIEAAFQNPGAVFVDAPWDVRVRSYGVQVDPREELLVFRTVADVLGDAQPLSRTTLDGQIQCVAFERQGQAILCVWDGTAPPEGRVHELTLGEGARVVDLWGRGGEVPTVGRRQLLRVGPLPVFVTNTFAWFVEFRRLFTVTPATLEPNFDKTEFEVSFRNTYREPISGQVRLVLPVGWEVRPDRLSFSLGAEAVFREKVVIRFPLNAPARVMPLVGEFIVDANARYSFTTPAWFDFGLEGIDLSAISYRSGDRVTVRVSMTNRTAKELFFEGYLVIPNRPRLQQLFHNLQPGQSMVRKFVIHDAAELAGKSLRVSLKETQGSRIWNRIVTVP
ncbi:MAG TPA: hypothetical protein PKY77_08800 [Phycisphaerae bacterium]|nr:hypothetical protein [Phycisphaerae bacterium]HRY67273.1 hypothetical protein [Phycisphaerae bacterium]HSA26357.1 hypothetical protein [Phycisphaerae bacterium]